MTRINEKSTRTPAMRGTNPGTGHDNVLSTIPLHISPEREHKQLFGDLKAVDRVLISKNVDVRKRRAVFAIDDPNIYEVFHKTNTVNDTNDGYGPIPRTLQKMANGYNNWRNGNVDARKAPKPESLGNPIPDTQTSGARSEIKTPPPAQVRHARNQGNDDFRGRNLQSTRPYPDPGMYRPNPATNPLQGPIGGLDPRQIPSGINVTYGFGVNQRQSTLPNPPRIDQQGPTPSDSQQVNRQQQPAISRPVLPMPNELNISEVKQALRTNIDIAVPIDSHELPYRRAGRLKEFFGPGSPNEGSFHTFLLHPEKTKLDTLKKMVAAWNNNVADHPAPIRGQHTGQGAPQINLDSNQIQVANVPQRRSDSGPFIVQWTPPWNVNNQDPPPVTGTNKMALDHILNPNR